MTFEELNRFAFKRGVDEVFMFTSLRKCAFEAFAAMGSLTTRSFNWITGGSFNQTFSARIYGKAHQSEHAEWPWHIVAIIDFFLGKQHCFNEWLDN